MRLIQQEHVSDIQLKLTSPLQITAIRQWSYSFWLMTRESHWTEVWKSGEERNWGAVTLLFFWAQSFIQYPYCYLTCFNYEAAISFQVHSILTFLWGHNPRITLDKKVFIKNVIPYTAPKWCFCSQEKTFCMKLPFCVYKRK